MSVLHTKFETELQVRPDDIDVFNHVHSRRYMDYVLAAHCEQMACCYGWTDYAMITLATGRATPISDDIKVRYSIAGG